MYELVQIPSHPTLNIIRQKSFILKGFWRIFVYRFHGQITQGFLFVYIVHGCRSYQLSNYDFIFLFEYPLKLLLAEIYTIKIKDIILKITRDLANIFPLYIDYKFSLDFDAT